MKNHIIAMGLAAVTALSSIPSCTELEDTNYHTIMTESMEFSGDDLGALLAAAYIPWRELMLQWNGVVRAQELTADQDVIPARPNGWVDGGIYKRMHQHKWTSEEDFVLQGWTRTFSGINSCNRVIYQLENDIECENEQAVISELKVLRASFYWVLCDMYGSVPIVTKFDVPDGYLPQQNTRKEVYDFIIKEITENINNLSENVGAEMYGRFNKWAAYTLLAKVYLNAEVYTSGAESKYAECIEACQKVIECDKYRLEDEQKNCFITENENSCEAIFSLAIDDDYVTGWNDFDFHLYTLQSCQQQQYQFENAPWGGVAVVPQFIDSYDADDERLANCFIKGYQLCSNGDTVYYATGKPLKFVNSIPSIDKSNECDGYRWGKFEYAVGSTNRLSNDFHLFRYADVLLMKAESLLRTGKADEAAVIVTNVRERNFTAHPEKAIVTGTQLEATCVYDYGLRDSENETHDNAQILYGGMLDELGREFTQEGRRRSDMIRFGAFTTVDWFSHTALKQDYLNLFPLPHTAIAANGNLKQNPGY